jgi:hypothetical protein
MENCCFPSYNRGSNKPDPPKNQDNYEGVHPSTDLYGCEDVYEPYKKSVAPHHPGDPQLKLNFNPPVDAILMSMVRTFPSLLAMEFCNVQPMLGPSDIIFSFKGKSELESGHFYAPYEPGKKYSKYRLRVENNIEMMKQKAKPQAYEGLPSDLRRELDVRKQVDCIEIIPNK